MTSILWNLINPDADNPETLASAFLSQESNFQTLIYSINCMICSFRKRNPLIQRYTGVWIDEVPLYPRSC